MFFVLSFCEGKGKGCRKVCAYRLAGVQHLPPGPDNHSEIMREKKVKGGKVVFLG